MYFSFCICLITLLPTLFFPSFLSITWAFLFATRVAGDALVDDSCNDSLDISEEEENVHHLWKLARKFWLPVFFFLTVLTNLDDPIAILFIKVTLFLLTTKPNPFSVYVFVDQVRYHNNNLQSINYKLYLNNIFVVLFPTTLRSYLVFINIFHWGTLEFSFLCVKIIFIRICDLILNLRSLLFWINMFLNNEQRLCDFILLDNLLITIPYIAAVPTNYAPRNSIS